ncbi:MAG: threonylcarbamoyl-AMP synthase [Dehalococcoidia bacterium]|nr:threonylcarbamoyl-AMP synthase [Dehalococcoidia bacterium]
METEVLAIDSAAPDPGVIARAAAVVRRGGLVAFPTETVYGLGANALDADAVGRIFAAKERAADDPLIVHLADAGQLATVAREVPPLAVALAAAFWPGPLTLVLPKRAEVPAAVTAGLDSVAVRVPRHPVAHALIATAGVPVAAPSANRFTRTSATTAAHVLEDLGGRIDMVLDGGPAEAGIESTVVAVYADGVSVLRPGAVPTEAIAEVVQRADPAATIRTGAREKVSPGMMAKHYAPRARLTYVTGPREAALARVRALVAEELAAGRRAALLLSDEDLEALADLAPALTASLGPRGDHTTAARRLFAALRELDQRGAESVFAIAPETMTGYARAIDDRLRRAAARVE